MIVHHPHPAWAGPFCFFTDFVMIKRLDIMFHVPALNIALRVQALAGMGESVLEAAKKKVREEMLQRFPGNSHAAVIERVSYAEGRRYRELTHQEFVLADDEAFA